VTVKKKFGGMVMPCQAFKDSQIVLRVSDTGYGTILIGPTNQFFPRASKVVLDPTHLRKLAVALLDMAEVEEESMKDKL